MNPLTCPKDISAAIVTVDAQTQRQMFVVALSKRLFMRASRWSEMDERWESFLVERIDNEKITTFMLHGKLVEN